MASLDDFQLRKGRIDDLLHQLFDTITTFETKTRSSDDLMNEVNNLNDELGTLKNKIEDQENLASTHDRNFLEKKGGDTFQKNNLYTVQDFTLFLFFISYLICGLAFVLMMPNKITGTVSVLLIGLIICMLLIRFA